MTTQVIDLCGATLFCMKDAAFRCRFAPGDRLILACPEHKEMLSNEAEAHGHVMQAEPLITAGNDAGQMPLIR
jgi:hypothetical protein